MNGLYYPSSLVNRVAQAVMQRGEATLDDIAPEFPSCTRRQLHAALANARDRRILRIKDRGHYRTGRLSVWEEAPKDSERKSPAPPPSGPVPSVWKLAERGPWHGPWPPLPAGRVIDKLGPWFDPADA